MAQITRRGPGRFRARVRKQGFPDQSKTFNSRAQAERWAKMIETQMDDGVFQGNTEAANTTLREAIERYDLEVSQKKKSARDEAWRIKLWKNSSLDPGQDQRERRGQMARPETQGHLERNLSE